MGIECKTDLSVLKDWNMDLTNSAEINQSSDLGQAM